MADYLAMIKMTANSTPSKVNFAAENVKDAINKILHYTRCGSTTDIHAYEVLEIVPGGYRPVAVKEAAKGSTISHVVVADFAVRPDPPKTEEHTYNSYSVAIT